MISAGDFKNGMTFEMDGNVMQVIDFQHVKPGKGAAFVRAKIRNIISGGVTERTFNPSEKYEKALVERKKMQYLYADGDLHYFMDLESYEQIPIAKDLLGEDFAFVKENMECEVSSFKGSVFNVAAPMFVDLLVTHADPAVAGDTARNVMKPCTLETGVTLKVPLFIEVGEMIRIDTRTGEYMERTKS